MKVQGNGEIHGHRIGETEGLWDGKKDERMEEQWNGGIQGHRV